MYLSHSQIEMWQQCQYRWYLAKIKKVPQAPAEALVLGTAFHTAIEAAGRHILTHEKNLVDDLIAIGSAEIARAVHQDTTHFLADRWTDMSEKLVIMLNAFIQQILPLYKPISVEESFHVPFSTTLQFTGRIDACTTKSIIDFKTGKRWEDGIEHTKSQASAYLAAKPLFTRVTFIVFSVHDRCCDVQILPTQRTDDQRAAYITSAKSVASQIETAHSSGNFPAKTGVLCGWCATVGSCPVGQQWLVAHHRTPMVPMTQVNEKPTSGNDAV